MIFLLIIDMKYMYCRYLRNSHPVVVCAIAGSIDKECSDIQYSLNVTISVSYNTYSLHNLHTIYVMHDMLMTH